MSSFKKFVVTAVLAVGAVAGVAVVDLPAVGTQRASAEERDLRKPVAPWFSWVRYKGHVYGLGGYKTQADAIKYAQMWCKGVGGGATYIGVTYNPKN